MKNKELIINLIQQDLKYNQLLGGLEKIGFDSNGLHSLELLDLVSKLMRVSQQFSDRWSEVYNKFMDEAIQLEMMHKTASLRPLAESCYKQLKTSLDK